MLNNNIKKLRTEHNLTQEDLAKQLNLSVSTISMYETGAREPDISTLIKISQFFNVTTDFLLGLTSNEQFTVMNYTKETDITKYIINLTKAVTELNDLIKD